MFTSPSAEPRNHRRQRATAAVSALICLIIALLGFGSLPVQAASRQSNKGVTADTTGWLRLDLEHQKLSIMMGPAVLFDCPVVLAEDSDDVAAFAAAWGKGEDSLKAIKRVHVYSAEKTVNDTELKIVAEVSEVPEETIQRYRPSHMVLITVDGFRIVIESDAKGETFSTAANILESVSEGVSSVLGPGMLHLTLSADDAMALYGVARFLPPMVVVGK